MFFLAAALVGWIGGDFVNRKVRCYRIVEWQCLLLLIQRNFTRSTVLSSCSNSRTDWKTRNAAIPKHWNIFLKALFHTTERHFNLSSAWIADLSLECAHRCYHIAFTLFYSHKFFSFLHTAQLLVHFLPCCTLPRASAEFWLGGQCPLATRGEENLTTKWCILKCIWINVWLA